MELLSYSSAHREFYFENYVRPELVEGERWILTAGLPKEVKNR